MDRKTYDKSYFQLKKSFKVWGKPYRQNEQFLILSNQENLKL